MTVASNTTMIDVVFNGRNNSEIILALGVIGILILMIMPIPAFILDLLLSLNITLSLVILLVGMNIMRPLELSSFPAILLLTTLFRLSLNIASTRTILLHGNEGAVAAGKVIKAFGSFVVGGNYLVGIIVFLILVIINFVVITKGAGRIAEVAARFTLDAMPGKQMSIDADLNAGIIDEEEAKARRKTITQEAEYYGAMDGANKFVRGDAIAGIIITVINILGGLAVGVLQNGMSFTDAAQTYTILTVGDGLVSQIPALVISTSAGIIVSRAAGSDNNLGNEISSQLLIQPRAIGLASGVLAALAAFPGLPSLPFLILAIIAGFTTYRVSEKRKKSSIAEEQAMAVKREKTQPEIQRPLPLLDSLSLSVGYGLIPLVDEEQNGELLNRIRAIRKQIAEEIGIVVPSIHIQDNLQLKPGEYSIVLKGNEISRNELMINYFLAMDPGDARKKIDGISVREPTYGLPAVWIKENQREKAIAYGYTVVDVSTVLTTHLSEIIRKNASELLGRQEVQELLDHLKLSHPKVVEELVPNILPLGSVVKVLQKLLKEKVPVRDLLTIMETLADWATMTNDINILTEYVRQALGRTITNQYLHSNGELYIISLNQEVEKTISESLQKTEGGTYLALEPDAAESIIENITEKIRLFEKYQSQPILTCSAYNRPHLRKIIERFIPELVLLSYDELTHGIKINSIGSVG